MTEINEIQTLTTPKGVYNSFPDLTARKELKTKLNAPGNVKAGDYLRVQSIGADGTVVLEGAEGPGAGSGQNANHANICTFLDAYVAWCNGEKFPIAFYGDSTFYGTNTSGAGHTFCDHLQTMLREECGANATVYRVAAAGTTLDNGINYFDSNFGATGTYADTKMLGIGYGINDRLAYETYEQYKNGVYAKLDTLIQKCFARGIQPFLVTSQATIECGVATNYTVQYPLRDANSMNVCANGAKKELAEKYGIHLVDLNRATELYLLNSTVPVNTIISDRLHFGDVGHLFEAGFLFSEIVPRVVSVDGPAETVLSYASQNLRFAIPEDKLSYGGRLKLSANYTRANTDDIKIFDAYVFVRDYPVGVVAYRNNADAASYVRVDGATFPLSDTSNDLGILDIGVHHLEALSGAGTIVDFAGFVINSNSVASETIPVETIEITPATAEISVGETIQLNATVSPADASNKGLYWTSSNSNCTVSASGLVTAVNSGSCAITASAVDGSGVSGSCVVGVSSADDGGGDDGELTVLIDSTNIAASEAKFINMTSTVVPVALMFGTDGAYTDGEYTTLSGKRIDSIYLNLTPGTITIGKVDLTQYGSDEMDLIAAQTYTVSTDGYNTIEIGGLEIGATETLAVGAVGDTAHPYCVYDFSNDGEDTGAWIVAAGAFKAGTKSEIGMKCKIIGS